jgi:diacylglycerol kinase family enzyme
VELADNQESLTVAAYRPVPHQVDGEYLGLAESFTVHHHPGVLDLVVPPSADGI